MRRESRIVEDGRRRFYKASVKQVRAEVEEAYAEELREAGLWRRIVLRWRLEREVREWMKKIEPPPPESLY